MLEFKMETTTDCVKAAEVIVHLAGNIETREDHVRVWDKKVSVLRAVNEALESGAFTGEAYNELWEAKHLLYKAEKIAGERSLQTYAKR